VAAGCIRLARRLEPAFGHIAEVGYDVVSDRSWGRWLVEANPRPEPLLFQPYDPEAFRRVACAPLCYATRLAGYTWAPSSPCRW
jgi:hypothetical protein